MIKDGNVNSVPLATKVSDTLRKKDLSRLITKINNMKKDGIYNDKCNNE